jgi:O-antigen/teichoic acid export membrane protein
VPGSDVSEPAAVGLPAQVRRLGVNSSIYALATLMAQGIQFFLVPLYTRVLTPADYGILTVCTTVFTVAGLVLALDLYGAISRLYFEARSPEELASLYGTTTSFLVVVPGVVMLLIDRLGMSGHLDWVAQVPFDPYLRLTLWAAYFSMFLNLPVGVYSAEQRPKQVMIFTVTSTLATVGLNIWFVVFQHQGALGSLKALLGGNLFSAAISLATMWRLSSPRVSSALLKRALVFSLPLVPHVAGNWAISQSDRLILSAHVAVNELGLYSLAFQIAYAVAVVCSAVNGAVTPMVFAHMKPGGNPDHVPKLGTYALLVMSMACLGGALLGGDVIRLVTHAKFHGAAAFLPWVALANGFVGLYFVWSLGSWVSMRTAWMPLATLAAGGISVALNLTLVPRFGLAVAPINMAASYAALALIHGGLAQVLYPMKWEYRRWIKIALVGAGSYVIALALARSSLTINIVVKTAVTLVVFPIGLMLVGFVSPAEWGFVREKWEQLRGRA